MAITKLAGKCVFIMGAASGIGAATARVFAEQQCELVLADLSVEQLQNTVADVEAAGARVHALELDVTDAGRFNEVAREVIENIGLPHVVINNAGIGGHGSFLNVPMDVVRGIMEVNLFGVMNGCHAFLPALLEAGDARHLVNVASAASVLPVPNMTAYAASKYAVDGLTEVLSMEWVDSKVAVSCIHPGIINTPIAQGQSHNGDEGKEQVRRLGEYYQAHGSDPRVVGEGILEAVRKDTAHVYVGKQAGISALLKRLSPKLAYKMALSSAKKIGYA